MLQAETKKISLGRKRLNMIPYVIGALCVINAFLIFQVMNLSSEYTVISTEVKQSRAANEKVLAMLKDIRDEQEEQSSKLNQAMKVSVDKRLSKSNVMQLKATGYSQNTDIGANSQISVEDMDKIIAYYDEHIHTGFTGHGKAFVEAAKETGLNPIYIFAHAACESSYGTSYLAVTRHNYFGINAVDSNPGAAFTMGDAVDEGIIEGAKWIKSNFYDNGYTTLASMHNAGYASDPDWAKNIASVANAALEVL